MEAVSRDGVHARIHPQLRTSFRTAADRQAMAAECLTQKQTAAHRSKRCSAGRSAKRRYLIITWTPYFSQQTGTVEASTENMGEGQNRSDREYYREVMLGKVFRAGTAHHAYQRLLRLFPRRTRLCERRSLGVLVGAINMDYIASHTIDPVTMHGKGSSMSSIPMGKSSPPRQAENDRQCHDRTGHTRGHDGGSGSFETNATA